MPGGWERQLSAAEVERQVWSPAPDRNPGKETLAVRVAKRRPTMPVEDILAAASAAQGLLPDVSVVDSHRFTTRGGLEALWVETSFKARNGSGMYRRTHVTAIGKEHVFHVFYTALSPDPEHRVLQDAVDSLHEEG